MPETKNNCPPDGNFREACCIDAGRVYDSCCDRDCVTDLRLFFNPRDNEVIQKAVNVKIRTARVVDVTVDVEPVHLNRGFFACDLTFFFVVKLDAFVAPHSKPVPVRGVCSFDKKVILYGSEGSVKVFSNEFVRSNDLDHQTRPTTNLPKCVVSCVDPIPLSAKLVPSCNCSCCLANLPGTVCCEVGKEIVTDCDSDGQSVLVTLGLFSIVQLIRNVQMLIPVYDFCVPEKQCSDASDSPCDLFSRIQFPLADFFPSRAEGAEGCGCREADREEDEDNDDD